MSLTPEQQTHIDGIVAAFDREVREKYAAGQVEHGGNIWEKPGMLQHAKEEVLDQWVYLCTLEQQLAKRPAASPMRVVYIAGKFRGPSAWDIECNIRVAEALSLAVWRMGCAALCPHTNTRYFQNAAPDDVWLAGDLALLERCDALLTVDNWKDSAGARAEVAHAITHGIPVFHDLAALAAWKAR